MPPFLAKIKHRSLQLRLTLELVSLSVIGVAGVTIWAGWQLETTLISSQKQTLDFIAARFPDQVELYRKTLPIEESLSHAIDAFSSPGLLIWIRGENGAILTQSQGMNVPSLSLIDTVSRVQVTTTASLMHMDNSYVVLCSGPLTLNQLPVGEAYFLKDITHERKQINASVMRLLIAGFSVVVLLLVVIPIRIGSALFPLQEMSHIAQSISAEKLAASQLKLENAPTEILGLAETFNQMLERLSLAWEQQRQFVGNVSHELRTPLAVIKGYLESLLRTGKELPPHHYQAIATAAAEAERTTRMLEDLLDLTRAESGKLYVHLTPVVLNSLIMEVAVMSQRVSAIPIQVQDYPEAIIALTDQDRLQQVLLNVIDNAIKYANTADPIEVILTKTVDHAFIHIRDHGIGIPLAHQQRIFERFYRVDDPNTRSRSGTGLGLAIAKSLMESMGGKITVRSKPGEGSQFTLTIPLWHPPL